MIPKAMLCQDQDHLGRFFKLATKKPDNVLASKKLDGVRTVAVVPQTGPVTYLSRNQKHFPNFGKFDADLKAMAAAAVAMGFKAYPVIFDGEVTSKDQRFSKVMSQLRRLTEIDDSIFEYHIFDLWMARTPLSKRLKALEWILREARLPACTDVKLLPHTLFTATDVKVAKALADQAIAEGFEGCVFKMADSEYKHTRSIFWCKCKAFETADVRVIGYEMGEGRLKGMLGALVIDFKGVPVNVGTGYDDKGRKELLENMPEVIEISYQYVTEAGSLRHPSFIRVREDKDVEEIAISA